MPPLILKWYHFVWAYGVAVITISMVAHGSESTLDDVLIRFKSIINSPMIADENLDPMYDLFSEIYSLAGIAPPTVLPESTMTTVELITNMGYKAEAHNVTTEDGYTIEIHRILPFGQTNGSSNRYPVLLQHGITCSSSVWVLNFPNQSLGFLLASAGFDVWMSNIRGNPYGKFHKYLKPDSKQFWNFGLDELSAYDLTAMIDYVLQATNSTQLQYVGHSMGTTMAFMLLSTKPQYNYKIRIFLALEPIVYLHHTQSQILKLFVDFKIPIKILLSLMKIYSIPPNDNYSPTLGLQCRPNGSLCMEAYNDFLGSNPKQLNTTRFTVYIYQILHMTSLRTLLHYAQIEETSVFCHYDWGYLRNLYTYRQLSPPPYPLENITTPTVLYVGANDHLATLEDVRLLIPRLPHNKVSIVASDIFWDHIDPVWGISAGPMVLNDVVQRLLDDSVIS